MKQKESEKRKVCNAAGPNQPKPNSTRAHIVQLNTLARCNAARYTSMPIVKRYASGKAKVSVCQAFNDKSQTKTHTHIQCGICENVYMLLKLSEAF